MSSQKGSNVSLNRVVMWQWYIWPGSALVALQEGVDGPSSEVLRKALCV